MLQRADIERLTVKELRACAHGRLNLPKTIGERKETLVAHVFAHASGDLGIEVEKALTLKFAVQERGAKRRREGEHNAVPARNPPHILDDHDPNRYLDLPSEAQVKALYKKFYDATSNNAVQRVVCGVCAREWGRKDTDVQQIELSQIPNPQRLKPEVAHGAHDLYDGMLLQPEGVYVDQTSAKTIVNVCSGCGDELRLASPSPVSFSLANGLWIGPIPNEVKSLTFLEQLLLGHVRTKCYVFKLWPKNATAGLDSSTMQRAMRGTVTSYGLNVPGAWRVILHVEGDTGIWCMQISQVCWTVASCPIDTSP